MAERIDLDVLVVGAGPAGLACALRLLGGKDPPLSVGVLEKAAVPGAHALSGAVLDPRALGELVPDFRGRGAPIEAEVAAEEILVLTRRRAWGLPWTPPALLNRGNLIVSLARLVRWLARETEAAGAEMLAGFSGASLLYDGDRVAGVRTGERGIGRDGRPGPGFEEGVEIRAKVTVLAEGVRGSLAKGHLARIGRLPPPGRVPFGAGVKEVWELRPGLDMKGRVIHTLGFPLSGTAMGGGFLYGMGSGLVSAGFVSWVEPEDPGRDAHAELQAWKTHPRIASILRGGKLVEYGAKAIPEGGAEGMPPLASAGCLLAGDAAGLVSVPRLKGIHLAMKSGIEAAEAIRAAAKAGDFPASVPARYEAGMKGSWAMREMEAAGRFHAIWRRGLLRAPWRMLALGLLGLPDRVGPPRPRPNPPAAGDGVLTFDKKRDVFLSGTAHRESEPSHLVIHDAGVCADRCAREFGNPCARFCPAAVYEKEESPVGPVIRIHAANCVHCKTCDLADPYGNITWKVPEGGEGPKYTVL